MEYISPIYLSNGHNTMPAKDNRNLFIISIIIIIIIIIIIYIIFSLFNIFFFINYQSETQRVAI